MAIKVHRIFLGGYTPNKLLMGQKNIAITKIPRPLITVTSSSGGFAKVEGYVHKAGVNFSAAKICIFQKSNKQLIWETESQKDGFYHFRNIAKGLDCFVIAFDPNNQYNAVIQDNVVPK